ncbi:MAG: TolC family protein [bacterium]
MAIKRSLFISLLVVGLGLPVLAQGWQATLKLAQQNNPDLISAAKQVESAKLSYYRSFSPFLPQVSANASSGKSSASYGLSVSQSLFSGFDDYFSSLSAKDDYDYYQASRQKAEADVYLQLRQSFVDLAVADEYITLYKQIFERRKNNTDLIKLRFESGREDQGALLRTEADQADAANNIKVAERSKSLARLKLSQLVSAEVDKAEGSLETTGASTPNYGQILIAVPSYIMYQKQLDKAELSYKKTISEFLPSVSLNGSYQKTGANWPPTTDSQNWSVSLSYSIFPGGANIADRLIYQAQLDKAKQDFQSGVNDLRYGLESAYNSYQDAVEAVKIAKLSLKAAAVRAEISRTKYLNGLLNYDNWDIIENDYITAQRNLLARKKAALYAEAAWHNAYGGYVK